MKVAIVSNFLNHHQIPLANKLYSILGNDFIFIATEKVPDSRVALGYNRDFTYPYLLDASEETSYSLAINLIDASDVVLTGSAPYSFYKNRIRDNKLVFRYSERPLKNGNNILKMPLRYCKWHYYNPKNSNLFMLCASAYASYDYSKYNLFENKMFKWGYFPETQVYEKEYFERTRRNNLLWCGRFLDWKHPDDALRATINLLEKGLDIDLSFIGAGPMEQELIDMANDSGYSHKISFLGPMDYKSVRHFMENSKVYLMTSDRKEGWGAVVNEAMNSGCCVIASHLAGSTPFLIDNNYNGLVYKSCDVSELTGLIKNAIEANTHSQIGYNAYSTIRDLWNAEIAAERFLLLSESVLRGKNYDSLFLEGPCSTAEIIDEKWFK